MLKFLIDQNVPKSVSLFLQKQEHDIKLVKSVNMTMTDKQVIALALKEKRIIVSNDKDFATLAQRNSKVDVILFDFYSQKPEIRIDGLKQILPDLKPPFGLIILQ